MTKRAAAADDDDDDNDGRYFPVTSVNVQSGQARSSYLVITP